MDEQKLTPQDYERLARDISDLLLKRQDHIISLWQERALNLVPAARTVNEAALRDSLPEFINDLAVAFKGSHAQVENDVIEVARKHGKERSEQDNYDLIQVYDEYQILRQVLLEVLEEGRAPLPKELRDIILNAIALGVRNSAEEFLNRRRAITEAATQEAKLRSAEAEAAKNELHDFFMQAPAPMVIVLGPEHYFSLANPPYARLVGRDVVGKTLYEAFTEEEASYFKPLLDGVYQTGVPYVGQELPLNIPDEAGVVREHFVDLRYHPFREADGKIKGILAVVQDVTTQVLARREVERAGLEVVTEKQKFEAIFLTSASAMALLRGPEHIFEMANPEYEALVDSRELIGKSFVEAIPELPDNALVELMNRVYETGETYTGKEALVPLAHGPEGKLRNFYFDFSYSRIDDGQGQAYGVYIHAVDVTEKVLARVELDRAKDEAIKANQLKSSFLANMSHEIRTPMTAVLGFTEVLKDEDLSEAERRDAISRIDSSGRALLGLIDDVLDISKIEAGKLEVHSTSFSPVAVASEVVALMRITAEAKGVSLRLRIDPSVPSSATSDSARLRQILMNLLGNAVKFTSVGEVVLRIKALDGHKIEFDVSDTGIGISESDRKKLFKPFAQADASITREFGGTGLGLLLSRRLAEQMSGSLVLSESTPGKGSRFTLTVNAAPFSFDKPGIEDGLGVDDNQWKKKPPELVLKGVRVLLAEDVPDNQVLMSRYLVGAGAEVEVVGNGKEAIEMVESKKFDLILMDIQMPILDGIQATRRLRVAGFDQPILALTAHAMSEDAARSIEAGCNDHLTKPIKRFDLVLAIRKHMKIV